MKNYILTTTTATVILLLFSVFLFNQSVYAQHDEVRAVELRSIDSLQEESIKNDPGYSEQSLACNTHSIAYTGSTFDGINTTFNYQVTGGGPPAISYWVIELCIPCTYVVSAGPGSITCGTDSTTGVYGLKFVSGLSQGQTQNYWITLNGQWPAGSITAAIDDGQISCFYSIQGPICEPDIEVVKTAITPTYSAAGDIIQYSVTVTNTGFFPLTNVTVNDPLTGLNVTIPSLAAGASLTFPTSYTVMYSDICNSQCEPKVYNTVTATGYYQQTMVTDTDDETVTGTIIPVYLNIPQAYTTIPCMSMNDIQTAFDNWKNNFTYGGGCDPQLSMSQTGTPDQCGGVVTVTWTVNSACQQTVALSSTFAVPAPSPVVVTKPQNISYSACDFMSQSDAEAAFALWKAGFDVSGGCEPEFTDNQTAAPDFCGGIATVIWTVTDQCFPSTTLSATFTISAAPTISIYPPIELMFINSCWYPNQASADAAFSSWLSAFEITGGCDLQITSMIAGYPDYCGGGVYVVVSASDLCSTPVSAQAQFIIHSPDPVNYSVPPDVSYNACDFPNQQAADAAFATWKAGFDVTGGCDPVYTDNQASAPGFCGGTATVIWTVTDLCYTTSTHTASFTITATPAVSVNGVINDTLYTCNYDNQSQIDAAFESWLGGFTVSGGCNPHIEYGQPVAPNYCGESTSVTWTVTDVCYMTTHTATFTVLGPKPFFIITPPYGFQMAGLDYSPLHFWLSEFFYNGGCNPVVSENYELPDLCGDTITVYWTVTDVCEVYSTNVEYIVLPGGSIGDFVWHDMNKNGIQNAGEPGIEGVVVHLSGDHTATTMTDADGYYFFDCLPAGIYHLSFESPGPDWYGSPASQGMDADLDSDPVGGVVTGIHLGISEYNRNIDAGFFQPNNIFCSLTQGGYGNAGGNYCGMSTTQLLNHLLTTNDGMVLGIPANNKTFTIPSSGAQCILSILPGGGPGSALNGNFGCGNLGSLIGKNGRLKNGLLAQTIVLQLNLWWSPDLGSLVLSSPEFYTRTSSNCADPGAYPLNDSAHYSLPASVYNALGSNPTVQEIFNLASNALGGMSVGPSLSAIQQAVDIINNAFDECRFVYFIPQAKSNVEPVVNNVKSDIDLHIMPNPFETETDIKFSVSKDSRTTVEIYNVLGLKVANLYNDVVEANKVYTVKYIPTEATGSQVLICVIRTDNGTAEKRMVLIR